MRKIGPVAVALSAMLASTCYAQSPAGAAGAETTSANDSAGQVGEIIVTAQRKSENLQQTPIAVTAVTAEAVQSLGLTEIKDIAAVTPGASFTTTNGFFTARIRGIGVDFVSVGLESPVAVYEDGAYLTRTLTVNEIVDNFDIGSIQVLRGPQGTLYGRNATGGVVIINSADPTNKFEGRMRAEYGNIDHQQLNGMINIPLGEDLAFRGSATYKHDGGYVRNLITGGKIGGGRTYSARGKLRWTPGNADIVLGGEYYDTAYRLGPLQSLDRNDNTCYACVLFPGSVGPNAANLFDTETVVQMQPVRTKFYGATLKMNFDFDSFELSSTTTYRKQKTRNSAGDADLTQVPGFEFAVPQSGGRSYTQDIQVSSKLDGMFNYLFGLSYLDDKGIFNTRFVGDPALGLGGTGLTADTASGADNTAKTKSFAAFAEGYLQFNDHLKATFGGRYTYEERSMDVRFTNGFALPTQRDSQRAFTPRFVLAWNNGPTNVYYSFTRGFKAGGFPGPVFGIIEPVKAEKIFSHEVGIKQSLFDNRVRLNAAAFYFKNKNLQTQTIDLQSGGTKTANAGALENYGVEVEAQVVPTEGLTLGLTGSWQHARFKPYLNAAIACYNPNINDSNEGMPLPTLSRCYTDLTGTPPPQAPDWSGSFNASYEFPIGTWTGSLSGIAQYRSSVYYTPGAGGELQADRDGSRFLVNASGYISPPGKNLRLGFYAVNVFNKKYVSFIQTDTTFGVYHNAARPRTYGLRVEYAF